jgi:hypothetical protein
VSAPDRTGRAKGIASAIGCVLLAVLAFVATAEGIARLVPRHLPVVDVKWQHFQASADAYTTVYVGSSVIFRHVVPDVVDAELQAAGIDERSFNFGVPNMTYAEANLLLDRILDQRPERLRRVVIDAHLFADFGKHNHFSPRHIWWHTLTETYYVAAYALERKGKWADKWERLQIDLKAFLRNSTSAGRLAEAFRERWDPEYIEADEDDIPVTREGYRPLDELSARGVRNRHRRFVRARAQYLKKVEAKKRSRKTRRLGAYDSAMLERLIRRIEDAGLEVVIVESPIAKRPFRFSRWVRRHARVISFDDPARYPELYDPAVHFDQAHLSDRGARLMSRMLGRLLAGLEPTLPPAAAEPEPEPAADMAADDDPGSGDAGSEDDGDGDDTSAVDTEG